MFAGCLLDVCSMFVRSCKHFIRISGVVHGLKKKQDRKLKLSDRHCKVPTEEIMGAQKFNFAPKFSKNRGTTNRLCFFLTLFVGWFVRQL